MHKRTLKRKQTSPNDTTKPTKPNPYPTHHKPTPEECLTIRDNLLKLHGFPQEFAQFRTNRLNSDTNTSSSSSSSSSSCLSDEKSVKCENVSSVLDGLVSTVLSQNTTETNSHKAFANLKSHFPSWELVLAADQKLLENAIRCGGLAPTKASCIKNILRCLHDRRGKLCLEYLRDMSIDEIKYELSSFKGIGPKTVSCVLLFYLQQDDFPVDTHILQIAKTLHWVPEGADAKKTYLHLNQRIPKELKFDLNCLLYTHGKMCNRCSAKAGKQDKKETTTKPCPLLVHANDL